MKYSDQSTGQFEVLTPNCGANVITGKGYYVKTTKAGVLVP